MESLQKSEAQELIDHMTMKFRMVKFARIPEYNQLFSGDPTWVTLEVGGTSLDGQTHGYKDRLSFPSYPGKHGTKPGTESDCTLQPESSESIQENMQPRFPSTPALSSMRMTKL